MCVCMWRFPLRPCLCLFERVCGVFLCLCLCASEECSLFTFSPNVGRVAQQLDSSSLASSSTSNVMQLIFSKHLQQRILRQALGSLSMVNLISILSPPVSQLRHEKRAAVDLSEHPRREQAGTPHQAPGVFCQHLHPVVAGQPALP